MSTRIKESLHEWVESLTDADAEALRRIADNQALADFDDEPLAVEGLEGIRRGANDIRAGRKTSVEEYRRKRGL